MKFRRAEWRPKRQEKQNQTGWIQPTTTATTTQKWFGKKNKNWNGKYQISKTQYPKMAVSLLDGSAGAGERLSARNTRPSGRLRPPDRPEATGDASASARPHSRPARLPGCLPARPAARPLAPARNDDSPLQGSMTTRTRFVGAGDMNIQLIRSKELQFFFLSLSFSLSLSLSLSLSFSQIKPNDNNNNKQH